ncbi:unnamed protein product [Calypogeia fissa]
MVGGGGGMVGLVYDERMCAHRNEDNSWHPEQPARITSIFKALDSAGIVDRCVKVEARDATPAELASVHTEEHIANMCAVSSKKLGKVKRAELARRDSIYFNEGSSNSALLAAGSVVEICLRVARGDLKAGAAVVRPPGHHAEADRAMGFCLFNNVAVAAHVLIHGNRDLAQKVLIVDWDVHHGNGTQHMFWEDPNVLYFSIHRYDFGEFYPGGDDGNYDKIGSGKGAGFNINVPWPQDGFGDLDYLAVFDQILMPVAQEFKPDLVLVSGGFDSGILHLMSLANGRLVLALEGGYNLESISDSYLACMKVILGDEPEKVLGAGHHITYTLDLVKEVRRELQQYWSVLSTKDETDSTIRKGIALPSREDEDGLAEDFRAEFGQETCEVNRLVEALNNSLSLDSKDDEVTTGSLVGNSILETTDANEEEKPGLGVEHAARTDKARTAGALEADAFHVEEPKICTQVAVETAGSASMGSQRLANGMDLATDEHRLTASNLGGGKFEISVPVDSFSSYPSHLDAERTYVWYACYASNLLMERFMCYIQGGQVEGMRNACLGSRNQTPPVASRWLMVPHNLFFGHSWTSRWGSGGVAFLDPVSHGGAPTTHVRLYKITLQQLRDLLIQENRGEPNNSEVVLEWDQITKLRDVQSALSHATLDIIKDSWYGTIKYLGDEDGLPIITVTCSVEDVQRFRKGQFKVCPPSESYYNVILKGLLEHETLSEEESRAYISSRCKRIFEEDSTSEKV